MLHKKRSKISNQWKFALVLPLLAIFLMSFNIKEIIVERPELSNEMVFETLLNNDHEIHDIVITKDHSEADLNKLKAELAKEGITLKLRALNAMPPVRSPPLRSM